MFDRLQKGTTMSDHAEQAAATPGYLSAADHSWEGAGLRDFFLYKDLGTAAATDGKVLMKLVKANNPPEHGTGWHRYVADFHIIYMLRGWARFMIETKECLVQAGDRLTQAPEAARYLFDYSPDMEYLEVVGPVDFRTVEVTSDVRVPPPRRWYQDQSRRLC
jgi:hypothetical protein